MMLWKTNRGRGDYYSEFEGQYTQWCRLLDAIITIKRII